MYLFLGRKTGGVVFRLDVFRRHVHHRVRHIFVRVHEVRGANVDVGGAVRMLLWSLSLYTTTTMHRVCGG